MNEPVKLQAISDDLIEDLLQLVVAKQQQDFVKPIAQTLNNLNTQQSAHLIMVKQQVIGFFVIDSLYPYQRELPLDNCVLLRSFFIGSQFQGKGYGFSAGKQLANYLSNLDKAIQNLALTVNCRNHAAQALYKKVGFTDSEVLYRGGPAGPQHIYTMKP